MNCTHNHLHRIRFFILTHRVEIQCAGCRELLPLRRFSVETDEGTAAGGARVYYSDDERHAAVLELVYDPTQ